MTPTTTRIPLVPAVPAELAGELSRRVYYVSESITGFTLVRAGDGITAVDVTGAVDADGLTRKLVAMVADEVLAHRATTPKVVWRAAGAGPVHDVWPELTASGAAAECGEGQVLLGEPVLGLMDRLDLMLRDLVAEEFGAVEYRYPTLIPTAALRRSGHIESFPQTLMAVTRLHGDADTYREFLAGLGAGDDLSERLRRHSGGFDHCLPPTMCFHTYHQLADRPLPAGAPLVVTARGKSFRNESRYHRSLERLWDFTIREVVFLGTAETVLAARRRLMDLTAALVESLDLGGRYEVAGDPFFLAEGSAARAWVQRVLELKYELRMPLDAERDVAVCSFNYHEQHFGTAFGITGGEGRPVFTGCAGFGLERLAYAFLCRHGLDPADWPEAAQPGVVRPGTAAGLRPAVRPGTAR